MFLWNTFSLKRKLVSFRLYYYNKFITPLIDNHLHLSAEMSSIIVLNSLSIRGIKQSNNQTIKQSNCNSFLKTDDRLILEFGTYRHSDNAFFRQLVVDLTYFLHELYRIFIPCGYTIWLRNMWSYLAIQLIQFVFTVSSYCLHVWIKYSNKLFIFW